MGMKLKEENFFGSVFLCMSVWAEKNPQLKYKDIYIFLCI